MEKHRDRLKKYLTAVLDEFSKLSEEPPAKVWTASAPGEEPPLRLAGIRGARWAYGMDGGRSICLWTEQEPRFLTDHMLDKLRVWLIRDLYALGLDRMLEKDYALRGYWSTEADLGYWLYRAVCDEIDESLLQGCLGVSPAGLVSKLAMEQYEGEDAAGQLAFTAADGAEEWTAVERSCAWTLETPPERPEFTEGNLRRIRKLLAGMENGALVLCVEGGKHCQAVGAGEAGSRYPCHIELGKRGEWSLYLDGKPRFQRRIDGYHAIQDKRKALGQRLEAALEAEFQGSAVQVTAVVAGLLEVGRQTHGAGAIVVDCNSDFVKERLSRLVEHNKAVPVRFNASGGNKCYYTAAAKMDGAVVMDVSGEIRLVATLFDGDSVTPADLARGSRYSSMKNTACLFGNNDQKIVAVVFSEDGSVDVFRGSAMAKR